MKKTLFLLAAIFLFYGNVMAQPMELEFNTNLSAGTTITLPLYGITSVTIYWGNGIDQTVTTSGDISHTYVDEGIYTVSISGVFTQFGKGFGTYDNADKLVKVTSFGDIELTSLSGAFHEATNLIEVPGEIPTTITNTAAMFSHASSFNQNLDSWDVSNVVNMAAMFRHATSFNGNIGSWNVENVTNMSVMFAYAENFNQDIGAWNVSNVTDMYGMFYDATSFNQDIGGWNVGNVIYMGFMFRACSDFNQDIGGWNVAEVTNMSGLFFGTENFNQNIGNWNVENVTTMNSMFRGSGFNQDISNWDVSKVDNMDFMFNEAYNFNQDISSWETGNVTSMKWMFRSATSFDQDIGSWDVSMVEDMSFMFYNAENFNRDIGGWNVENVTDMSSMFYDAINFNHDVSNWNVSKVETMASMFRGATSFNQDISGWDVGGVTNMQSMFYLASSFDQDLGSWNMSNVSNVLAMLASTNLTTAFYNNILIGWAGQSLQNGLEFHGGWDNKYSPGDAADARQSIIDNFGWAIYDGGISELPAVLTKEVSDINGTTAVSGGDVHSDGGYTITELGVVWNTTPNPSLIDNEGYTVDTYLDGTTEFESELSSLLPLETYYVRAYATNSQGTEYGNSYQFTTTKQELKISGSFTVLDKEYDGTTNATIDNNNLELSGIISGDDISLIDVVAEFDSAGPGENILVFIADANITGNELNNYYLSLVDAPTTTANITEPVNINEASIDDIEIYPNPFSDNIFISNADNISSIKITNLLGQIVLEKDINEINSINTSQLSNGLYILIIKQNNDNLRMFKILKQSKD